MSIKGKTVLGKAIVCLQNGQQIGRVKGLIIDPDETSVVALLVENKALYKDKMVVQYGKVYGIAEVVTVKYANSLEKAQASSPIGRLLRDKIAFYGAKVITEDGSIIGTIDDFLFDTATGKIETLVISGKIHEKIFKGTLELPISQVTTIGRDAVIAKSRAVDALVEPESHLAAKVEAIKASGSKVWNATRDTTSRFRRQLSLTFKNLKAKNKGQDTDQEYPCCLDPEFPAQVEKKDETKS
ncbi:MAG: PRC-barrel domain-containing protein [Bacillota bacterium]